MLIKAEIKNQIKEMRREFDITGKVTYLISGESTNDSAENLSEAVNFVMDYVNNKEKVFVKIYDRNFDEELTDYIEICPE